MSAAVRLKARHPSRSCLVQAPAGSGKTELLIQRILALLGSVDEPEEILALTFTRKAAAEMRLRVMEALSSPEPVPGQPHKVETWMLARQAIQRSDERGWHLIAHPARLRIMTLDSFSYSLARQLPLLSHLGAMPTPSDHPESLYREAAESALSEAMQNYSNVAEDVLLHQDNNAVAVIRLLANMLGKREQWLGEIAAYAGDTNALQRLLQDNLSAIMLQKIALCDALAPMQLKRQLPDLMVFAAKNRADEALSLPSGWPDPSLQCLDSWKQIANFLRIKGKPQFRRQVDKRMGFPAAREYAVQKEQMKQLLEMLAGQTQLAVSLHTLSLLPERTAIADGRQWQILNSLFVLLILANAHLQQLFCRTGRADFTEISLRAMQALGDCDTTPGDLLMKLDYSIHHILVDEFQDTSLLQMRLLRCLTAGWQEGDGCHRSLFMVGDPMQSIYRFRKAEVGLFLNTAQNRAGLPAVEPMQLKRNFRSSPAIVDWINRAFSSILPKCQEVISGAISYASATAALSRQGSVNLHLQQGRDAGMEAEAVVQLVQKERAVLSPCGEGQRIAVLARSRKHLHAIMPALTAAKIPFRASKILPLNNRPEVRLLRALLRALLHPVDRESWVAILRAPCCGLNTRDMHLMIAGDERPLWQIMSDAEVLLKLDRDAQNRVNYVRQALAPCVSDSGKVSVRDLLELGWQRLAMPLLIDATARLNVDAVLALIATVEEGGHINFSLLDDRLKGLYAVADGSKEAAQVELLTMHGAKGLQWDVVILPGLGLDSSKTDLPLLAFSDIPLAGKSRLLISAKAATRQQDTLYNFIMDVEKDKDNNEMKRLLYVACTRCETALHLFGHLSERDDQASKGSLLHQLLSHGTDCFGARISYIEESTSNELRPARGALNRVSSLPEILPAGMEKPADEITEYTWAGAAAAPVGNALHAALQHVAEIGIENWNKRCTETELKQISRMLIRDGLSGEILANAYIRCADGLQLALNSQTGKWLLSGRHLEAHSEWALSLLQSGQMSHHVIDRSFVDAAGVRWIIDYKTGSHLGGDIAAFLDREQERYAQQLQRYATILKRMEPNRDIRTALYFPMLDAFRLIGKRK